MINLNNGILDHMKKPAVTSFANTGMVHKLKEPSSQRPNPCHAQFKMNELHRICSDHMCDACKNLFELVWSECNN